MPCIVEPTAEELREQHRDNEIPKAVLCAVFRSMEQQGISVNDALDHLDLAEAGVSKTDALKWWRKHKAADEVRRADERAERRRKAKAEELRKRLSPEEIDILRNNPL